MADSACGCKCFYFIENFSRIWRSRFVYSPLGFGYSLLMTRFSSFSHLLTACLLMAAMLFQCILVADELGEAEALSESAEVVHNVGLHLAELTGDTSTDQASDDCDHCCQCSGHGNRRC